MLKSVPIDWIIKYGDHGTKLFFRFLKVSHFPIFHHVSRKPVIKTPGFLGKYGGHGETSSVHKIDFTLRERRT